MGSRCPSIGLRPAILAALLVSGCGDGGSVSSINVPTAGDGSSPVAPDARPHVDGGPHAPRPDVTSAKPDSSSVPPGCPPSALVGGDYAGSYTGTINGTIPLKLSGPMSFTLVASGSELSIHSGKVSGSLLGFAYSLPMAGKVSCGKLDGSGSGDIAGMQFSGTFTATWSAGAFSGGAWTGQDSKNTSTGSGSWAATKK